MAPDLSRLVADKLLSIVAASSSIKYICIIATDSGNLISAYSPDEILNVDVITAISALKRTVGQFVATMNLIGCPSLSLTGESHKFYCHEVGSGFLLAFYEEIVDKGSAKSEEFDTIIQDTIAELRLILQNLLLPP